MQKRRKYLDAIEHVAQSEGEGELGGGGGKVDDAHDVDDVRGDRSLDPMSGFCVLLAFAPHVRQAE